MLVFATGLRNGMTGMDDHSSTTENPAVTGFSFETIFSTFNLGMYAPLTWTGYAIAYAIGKDNALWYHLLSLMAHTFNTYLVYRLLEKLQVRKNLILPVALLFAIHPIQVEAVSWIAAFSTPLYTLFSLSALLYYRDYTSGKGNRYRSYGLALLMFVLSCLAKSVAVTVPLTLIALDLWRKPADLSRNRQWLGYVPFFAIALFFGLLTIWTRQESDAGAGAVAGDYSILERVLMVCYAPVFYLTKILVPLDLNIYYSFDKVDGRFPWPYFAAPAVVAALTFAAWRWREKTPFLYLGLLFYATNIAVALPFATIGTFELFADHYNYLACTGIFFVLVAGMEYLRTRFPAHSGILRFIGLVWLIALALLTFRQIRVWKDTVSVVSNAIDNGYHHHGRLYFSRGVEFGDLGKPQDAINDFSRAIEIDPDLRDAYKFRGSLYAQAGQLDPALADLLQYARLDSADAVIWNNLAMIYMRKNQLPKAVEAFTKTIRIKPDAAGSYQNRAKIYEMMGDTARMRADLQKARELASGRKGQ